MAGYIRQDTTNNIANGNIINANDLDNEYDAIAAAFGAITGHKHDGTDAEGAPITKVGPVQDVVVSSTAVTPKTDNTVDLGSSTSEFKDLYIDGVANIDSLVADTADINGGTIDNASVGATTPSTGAFTTLSATGAVSLSSGTANGVLYLNGSKAVSSGSGLVFDGSNLGLGVTSSAWSGGGLKAFEIAASGNSLSANGTTTYVSTNAYFNANWKYGYTGNATQYYQNAGQHIWLTAPSGTAGNPITFTQAMTLDASGNLLVGTTTSSVSNTQSAVINIGGAVATLQLNHAGGQSNGFVSFNYAGSSIGSISQSGTTAVAYNTSSDYRLKHDIAPMQNALQRVAALKPVTYKWNADNSDGEGFIAHELAEVCPQAVTGEKDAIDADGKPVYQGIDTSFLVATLTAAIQEQQAIITELRSRIEALEAK